MTTDTDKELINQLTNLKREVVQRLKELENRGYEISVESSVTSFAIQISKVVRSEETI